ncbi:hypothetical protein [Crossiella sp. CA198]|uniref:hypothetical protein n=1 Tax=Crossiella sp. CA198 TaxID=3455607 RepID=UPI003F8D3EEE
MGSNKRSRNLPVDTGSPEFAAAVDAARALVSQPDSKTRVAGLATAMVALRGTYSRADGFPDLAGVTAACKLAAREVYGLAGIGGKDKASVALQVRVRRQVQRQVREVLRGMAGGSEAKYRELCADYGIAEQTPVQAQHARQAQAAAGTSEPAPMTLSAALAALEAASARLAEVIDHPPTAGGPSEAARARAVKRMDAVVEQVQHLRGRLDSIKSLASQGEW